MKHFYFIPAVFPFCLILLLQFSTDAAEFKDPVLKAAQETFDVSYNDYLDALQELHHQAHKAGEAGLEAQVKQERKYISLRRYNRKSDCPFPERFKSSKAADARKDFQKAIGIYLNSLSQRQSYNNEKFEATRNAKYSQEIIKIKQERLAILAFYVLTENEKKIKAEQEAEDRRLAELQAQQESIMQAKATALQEILKEKDCLIMLKHAGSKLYGLVWFTKPLKADLLQIKFRLQKGDAQTDTVSSTITNFSGLKWRFSIPVNNPFDRVELLSMENTGYEFAPEKILLLTEDEFNKRFGITETAQPAQ